MGDIEIISCGIFEGRIRIKFVVIFINHQTSRVPEYANPLFLTYALIPFSTAVLNELKAQVDFPNAIAPLSHYALYATTGDPSPICPFIPSIDSSRCSDRVQLVAG